MNELPDRKFVRRGHVCRYLGITSEEMSEIVRAEVLRPLYLLGRGKAFFRRDEVIAAVQGGKLFLTKKGTP